jgi:multimeric flavodoxin WrbA
MRITIVQSSPNRDGLTAACAQAAGEGATAAGAEVEHIFLHDYAVIRCQACGNGWGECREQHKCSQKDDFEALHARLAAADALILVTPVYWGEPSESAKALIDRLRRCEATRGEQSAFANKWVLAVAAAGGSGNGTLTCLSSLERWAFHVRARPFDLIGITRRDRAYTLGAIREAGRALAEAKA